MPSDVLNAAATSVLVGAVGDVEASFNAKVSSVRSTALADASDALKAAHTAYNDEVSRTKASIAGLQRMLIDELSTVSAVEDEIVTKLGLGSLGTFLTHLWKRLFG